MIEDYEINYRNALNLSLEEKYSDSRQRAAAECIQTYRPNSVLEIGCATNPLSNYAGQLGSTVKNLVTLEPNKSFFDKIQNIGGDRVGFQAHNFSLEQYVGKSSETRNMHDFVVINCLLQEIEEPQYFLSLVKKICTENALVWVSVPNSESVHKLVAKNNVEFQQASFGRKWDFNRESLGNLIEKSEGKLLLTQSRILKPINDAAILQMVGSVPNFSDTFSDWLNFKSSRYYFGAELDVLFEFI